MTQLMSIYISDHRYEVSEVEPGMWNQSGLGRSNIHTGKIELKESLPEDVKMSTLLHEVVHQIFDLYDLPAKDETMISVISNEMRSFIMKNPEIIARIQQNGFTG